MVTHSFYFRLHFLHPSFKILLWSKWSGKLKVADSEWMISWTIVLKLLAKITHEPRSKVKCTENNKSAQPKWSFCFARDLCVCCNRVEIWRSDGASPPSNSVWHFSYLSTNPSNSNSTEISTIFTWIHSNVNTKHVNFWRNGWGCSTIHQYLFVHERVAKSWCPS